MFVSVSSQDMGFRRHMSFFPVIEGESRLFVLLMFVELLAITI